MAAEVMMESKQENREERQGKNEAQELRVVARLFKPGRSVRTG